MAEFSIGLLLGLGIVPLYRALAARFVPPSDSPPPAPQPHGDTPDRQQQYLHENRNFLHYDGDTQEAYYGTRD